MISDASLDLIGQIHDRPVKCCLVITGAGGSAISGLLGVAGASRTLIEAQVPYSINALNSYVGVSADQHVSMEESKIMAFKAYERAVLLSGSDSGDQEMRLIGLSCTAAIATDRLRRGENRAHITWHDGDHGVTYSLVMKKGGRDRAGEEEVCRAMILNALAEACGIEGRLQIELLEGEDVERVAH